MHFLNFLHLIILLNVIFSNNVNKLVFEHHFGKNNSRNKLSLLKKYLCRLKTLLLTINCTVRNLMRSRFYIIQIIKRQYMFWKLVYHGDHYFVSEYEAWNRIAKKSKLPIYLHTGPDLE